MRMQAEAEARDGGRRLSAGPLELLWLEGSLRYVRWGGVEVVRRIDVAVRNAAWGTVPGRISGVQIEEGRDGFRIGFVMEHGEPTLFRWRAMVLGTAEGAIRFDMDGEVTAEFERNRIGLCVIHPEEGFAGRTCEVETMEGQWMVCHVPESVAPHQPVVGMRALRYELDAGGVVELRWEGEEFEMEDHRNWTDSGFKTYGTPLARPYPVRVQAGERVWQSVALQVRGTTPPGARRTGCVELEETGTEWALPEVGVAAARHAWWPEGWHLERLRGLGFLRVEWRAKGLWPELASGLPVEVALSGRFEQARAWAERSGVRVLRWVLTGPDGAVPLENELERARAILPGPLVAASGQNFAELNRRRPAGPCDGLGFAVHPQVHSIDAWSVMENAAAQRAAVRTAREFSGGQPVHVTPIRLHPERPDERLHSPFGAAWTVASVKALAEGGAASGCWFESAGPAGVIEDKGRRAHPVWAVLAAVAAFRGGQVLGCRSSEPLAVQALPLRAGADLAVLVANLSETRQRARFRGLEIALEPFEVARRDFVVQEEAP